MGIKVRSWDQEPHALRELGSGSMGKVKGERSGRPTVLRVRSQVRAQTFSISGRPVSSITRSVRKVPR